ncbi:transcription factor Cys6 [Purpureocillium lilacinum]|uniref:Transcription factor Cys6 n=1 Tax=Purpureocillium lilacinum TaxID=33203 RepID=A0A179F6V4_PURLI|nr:transcription factor Cys6 [Purpureocillium lilacinum]OAQ60829.1 transcription factor Cys6 [Purpureocillium lilacinum]
MAASSSQSTLPQGFSVFQPSLGAQLQFFPALGSQQLDDMISAFIPGPASIKDKRATITVDFLEYSHMTGQNFKFYPVMATSPSAESPAAVSPSLDSASSSFNVSPVTSSWDWSAAASTTSHSSTQRRRQSSKASPPSRHQTATDFSSLPGMKILTKDGRDVTNSASRGSKTKEQRDHAHLMRIIKACDSCRRKKIRCDPSHKKRGAAQPQAVAAAIAKPAKKQRTATQEAPPLTAPQIQVGDITEPSAMLLDELSFPSFDLDSSLDFTALESLDASAAWDEFVQFPPMETVPDYDFFLDPENYFSQSSSASSSASPGKVLTPPQSQEVNTTPGSDVNYSEPGAPPGGDLGLYGPNAPPGGDVDGYDSQQSRSPQYPFLDQPGSAGSDYTDFNLYSPESTFSEDERMLPIGNSSSSLSNLNEPQMSECPPPIGVASGDDVGDWEAIARQFNATGDNIGGMPYYDPGLSVDRDENVHATSAQVNANRSDSVGGRVLICCPPGTVVMAEDGSDTRILDHVSTSLNVSGLTSTSPELAASESPALVQSVAGAAVSASGERGSESPALSQYAASAALVASDRRRSEHPAAISAQDHVAAPASGADREDQFPLIDQHVDDPLQRPRLRPSGDVVDGQPLFADGDPVLAVHNGLTGLAPATASSVHPGQGLDVTSRDSPVSLHAVDVSAAESPGDVSSGEQDGVARAPQVALRDPGRHLAYRVNDAYSRGPDGTHGASLLYGQAVASTNVSPAMVTASQSRRDSMDVATNESRVALPQTSAVGRVSASAPVVAVGDSQTAATTGASPPTSGNMAVAAAAVSAFVQYMSSVMAAQQSLIAGDSSKQSSAARGVVSRPKISDRTRAVVRSQAMRLAPMGAAVSVAAMG